MFITFLLLFSKVSSILPFGHGCSDINNPHGRMTTCQTGFHYTVGSGLNFGWAAQYRYPYDPFSFRPKLWAGTFNYGPSLHIPQYGEVNINITIVVLMLNFFGKIKSNL